MEAKGKRILVTGATGFIGSYICRFLLKEGYEDVHVLKRKDSSLELLEGIQEKLTFHDCDILDLLGVDKIVASGFDAIIHAAAIVSFSPKDDEHMIDANRRGTQYLVDSALRYSVARFVHISSVAALGKNKSGAVINEDSEWEDSKHNSPYSISKKSAEMEVWRGYGEGLSVVILNPSIVLGAGHWSKSSVKIFGNMIRGQKLYPAGSNGFVDVRDVASATIKALERTDINGQRFLLNATNLSFKDLMDEIAKVYKVEGPRYKIRNWMIPLSWRLMNLYSFITRKVTVYNKYSVISSSKDWTYDNSRSVEVLGIQYRDMDQTIQSTAEAFLQSQERKKSYGFLSID